MTKNNVVGKGIKFHYSLRNKIGIALFFAFSVYATYSCFDLFFVAGFEPSTEENNQLIRHTVLKLAGFGWLLSMVVYYMIFDRPMRAKLKTIF